MVEVTPNFEHIETFDHKGYRLTVAKDLNNEDSYKIVIGMFTNSPTHYIVKSLDWPVIAGVIREYNNALT